MRYFNEPVVFNPVPMGTLPNPNPMPDPIYPCGCCNKKVNGWLVKYSDNIFYNCGLYDKLYYDSSLIENNIINCYENDVKFNFLDLQFDQVHSVFYFEKNINFIGGMWSNIFKE